jgi:hypothetical protein
MELLIKVTASHLFLLVFTFAIHLFYNFKWLAVVAWLGGTTMSNLFANPPLTGYGRSTWKKGEKPLTTSKRREKVNI